MATEGEAQLPNKEAIGELPLRRALEQAKYLNISDRYTNWFDHRQEKVGVVLADWSSGTGLYCEARRAELAILTVMFDPKNENKVLAKELGTQFVGTAGNTYMEYSKGVNFSKDEATYASEAMRTTMLVAGMVRERDIAYVRNKKWGAYLKEGFPSEDSEIISADQLRQVDYTLPGTLATSLAFWEALRTNDAYCDLKISEARKKFKEGLLSEVRLALSDPSKVNSQVAQRLVKSLDKFSARTLGANGASDEGVIKMADANIEFAMQLASSLGVVASSQRQRGLRNERFSLKMSGADPFSEVGIWGATYSTKNGKELPEHGEEHYKAVYKILADEKKHGEWREECGMQLPWEKLLEEFARQKIVNLSSGKVVDWGSMVTGVMLDESKVGLKKATTKWKKVAALRLAVYDLVINKLKVGQKSEEITHTLVDKLQPLANAVFPPPAERKNPKEVEKRITGLVVSLSKWATKIAGVKDFDTAQVETQITVQPSFTADVKTKTAQYVEQARGGKKPPSFWDTLKQTVKSLNK